MTRLESRYVLFSFSFAYILLTKDYVLTDIPAYDELAMSPQPVQATTTLQSTTTGDTN